MAELESQVNELKNSIPKDFPKQHNFPNFERFEQKLAKLESELRELKHPVVSKEPSPPTDEDSLNSRLKKAENSVTKQSHRNMEQTRDLEAMSLRMKELEKKFESISNVGSRLHELEKRPTDFTQLALPSQMPDTPSHAQIQHTDTQLKFLQNRLQGLEGRFDLLAKASKMTHDIHMQELEKDTKRIGQLETDYHQFAQRLDKSAKELAASQTAYANSITGNQSGINLKVRDDLNKLSGAVDKVSKEMVPELSKSLGKSNGLLQSVIQGTRSLESRFQQLTTEPLVKHMMHAMQEMYPSVGTLSEQVQAFKGHAEKEIAEVKQKLEKLEMLPSGEAQSEALEKLRAQLEKHQEESTGKIDAFTSGLKKDLRSQLDDILVLRNDFATQSNAVADLGEKIASGETEWPPDDCRKLLTSVSDLREEIKILTSKVDNLTPNATTKSQTEQLETRLKALEELASPETAEWIKEKFAELDRIQHESIPRIFNRIRTYEDCSRSVQSPAENVQKLDKSSSDNPSKSGTPQVPDQQPSRGSAQGQLAKAMLKKKRSRHSLASDDDRSLPGTPSASNSSPVHPSSSSDISSSKKNKRKKKRKDQDATQR
ncbi:hypothetical protein NUU61_001044 [Penicillium alfredii]|uniref:Uncharacterized protein n=1 Tax=Penicillium alfredii TaxID=1506179 RepID=A0A9W9GAQ4_9EURO|nr:uncharacterized protein NUU61_001044 [Penicillium alfredii]KAJ5115285.1 hypothetical protein NUU61_001044 [Penicillium alfredii]